MRNFKYLSFITFIICTILFFHAVPCSAVTRTELLLQFSDVLGYDAVNAAQDSGEQLTCRDALGSVFEAAGFAWELSLLENFEQMPEWGGSDSVTDLAKLFSPAVPADITANPDSQLSDEQCTRLLDWLKLCKNGCSVRIFFAHRYGPQLQLLRKNLGNPTIKINEGSLQNKPLFSATVIFDPKDFKGRIALAGNFGGPGKIALAAMADETYGAVAAINGGYFYKNRPVGILRNEGITIWGTPWPERSGVCWNDDGTVCFISGSNADYFKSQDAAVFGQALQAGPRLLENRRHCNGSEKLSDIIISHRHPRSIIGTDGNKIYLTVIDGRNNMHSCGTTIEETKAHCAALGMKDALNLDGGGSSSLWWMGRTVTLPSNKGTERPLPYGILFTRPEEQ